MTTVLLTLGRLPKALDLARGFARAGCRVLVAEPYPWHLARVSRDVDACFRVTPPAEDPRRYREELAAIVAREGVGLVVPVSEETMHVAFLHEAVAPARVFTMPAETVLAWHDKARFASLATAAGLRVPETHPLGSEAGSALARQADVVVKPVRSCSGRGMRVLRRGEALPPADPADPAIVQRFVAGEVWSTCTIAQEGQDIGTAIYRGTMLSGTVAVAFERVEHRGISEWVGGFLAATRWSGLVAFDFVVDAEGVAHGIECNPRSTSGLHFFDERDLGRAILEGASPRFRPERHLQQAYSALTETWAAGLRGEGVRHNLRRLFTTRDVTWAARDPLPFLTMTFTSWRIIRLSIARGTTFGQVAMLDLAWRDA